MRQTITPEYADEHKAVVSARWAGILPFWLSTSRLRLNFDAAELGRKIATNNFGIREMSVQYLG
jgi:hypothetical protein